MTVEIRTIIVGPLETNCYLVTDGSTGDSFAVDPGFACSTLIDLVRDLHLTDILLTHSHFDHIGGVSRLVELTGARVWVHSAEAEWLQNPHLNLSAAMGELSPPVSAPAAAILLQGHEEREFLGEPITVLHTPGHTPGHVTYLFKDVAFVGDLIFRGSVGRTDFPGGNSRTLIRSIEEAILPLPADVRLLPGHGPATTVGEERRHNPFLAGL